MTRSGCGADGPDALRCEPSPDVEVRPLRQAQGATVATTADDHRARRCARARRADLAQSVSDLGRGTLHLPVEGVLIAAALLLLPQRAARVLATIAGVCLGISSVLTVLDIGFLAVLARPFDPIADWALADSVVDLLTGSLGRRGAVAALVGFAVLVVGAAGRGDPRRPAIGGCAASGTGHDRPASSPRSCRCASSPSHSAPRSFPAYRSRRPVPPPWACNGLSG